MGKGNNYQCPQCLWTGSPCEMDLEHNLLLCPTCKVVFDPNTWEKWEDD